jgi:hypothetical protein
MTKIRSVFYALLLLTDSASPLSARTTFITIDWIHELWTIHQLYASTGSFVFKHRDILGS